MRRRPVHRQRAWQRARVGCWQSARMASSELLVADNLGTDLQTPSRVGPRTFCASTQTPPKALGSEEFRLNGKKMPKTGAAGGPFRRHPELFEGTAVTDLER